MGTPLRLRLHAAPKPPEGFGHRITKNHSKQKYSLWFLELLTRFELVTRFTPKILRIIGDPGAI